MVLVTLWIHVLATVTWVGGMLFIALVLVPTARALGDPALRTRVVQEAGQRFRPVAWIAMTLVVVTGLLNLWLSPYLLWSTRLYVKLWLVVLAVILSAVHDFVLGPRAGLPGADPAFRRRVSWIARVNLVVVVVIVLLGVKIPN